MSNGAEIVADALMDSLLTGETFTVPTVNLNDPAFNFPSIVGNPLYNAVSELTNEDLTTRTVGGSGTYDAIMASQAAHLKDEFNQGRITGAEYTKAYIALAQAAAGQAIQFLLGKDQAYWASVIAQGQALTARVQHETAKVQLAIALVEMNNQRATFALNKIRLANEDAQYGINKYNLDNMLPAQKLLVDKQKDQVVQQTTNLVTEELGIVAKTAQTTQQTTNLVAEALNIPKQGVVLDNQAAQIAQQTTNLVSEELLTDAKTANTAQQTTNLAAEALNIPKQGMLIDANKDVAAQQKLNLVSEELLIDAKTSQTTQQTTNLVAEALNIPKQGDVLDKQALQIVQQTTNLVSEELGIDARTALAEQQKTNLVSEELNISKQGALIDANKAVQDAQKLSIEKNTEVADYNLDNLMPAQLTLIKEQGEVQRAQTLDTRSDAAAVAGSVKSQKDLYAQQVISYQRSSQTNAAKVWVDSWVADSALQDSPTVPTGFTSTNIGSVLTTLKNTNGL